MEACFTVRLFISYLSCLRETQGAPSTYPEDLYRTACFEDEIYGTIDMTERETCL